MEKCRKKYTDWKLERKVQMKKINFKKLYKRLLILVFMVYVIYTFVMQQQTLNAYKAEENKYQQEIQKAQTEQEYIEQIAREKLDMYLPNERVYIDIGK